MKRRDRQSVRLPGLRTPVSGHLRTASTGATMNSVSDPRVGRHCPSLFPRAQLSFDHCATPTQDLPISLDAEFEKLLAAFPSDSPLPFELEVNYSTAHLGLAREQRMGDHIETSAPLLSSTLHSFIPHSKRTPASLYNSSRNSASIEHVAVYPFFVQRIQALSRALSADSPSRAQSLEARLVSCLHSSIETEAKETVPQWDRLLHAFEDAVGSRLHSQCSDDPALTQLVVDARQLVLGEKDCKVALSELTKSVRIVLSKVKDRQLAIAVETVWACALYAVNRGLTQGDDTQTEETEEKAEKHENKQQRGESPSALKRQIVIVTQHLLSASIKQLQEANERLLQNAEHYVSLIKDRDAELKELHSFSGLRDLDKFTEELNAYLSDAEGRQTANVEVLESISQLLNHKWTFSPERRTKSRRVTFRPQRITTPDHSQSRQRVLQPEETLGPAKRPQGIRTFFSSQSNSGSHDGSPRPSRAQSPVTAALIYRDPEAVIVNGEIESPRLPKPDKVTGRGFTTLCIEIKPVSAGQGPGVEAIGAIEAEDPRVETVAREEPAAMDLVVAEENESEGEDYEVTYEDKETQTEGRTLLVSLQQREIEAKVPGPPRRKKPNLLLLQLEKLERKQPPMPEKLVFKLFESAMDEKAHSDNIEAEAGRQPKTMTEFMLDFMYTQYGLKTITLKNLSALINALEIMAGNESPYGVLICRLLEVFTEDPIDDVLAVFLTKARAAFCGLQNKAKGTQFAKLFPELGGKLALSDVADLVFVLFLADREAGEAVLTRLLPTDMSEVDRAAVLFCGKLAKTGREMKFFYIQIDTEKTGSVKYPAFEKGVRETCEVPVSKAQTLALWQSLETDSLSFAQLTKLNFKDYSQRATSKELSISKCDFMTEIAREYERKRELERTQLTALFREHDPQGEGVMSLEEFTNMVTALNPEISKTKAVSIFREALDYSDNPQNLDSVDPAAFCHIALKYHLGNAGRTLFDTDLKQLSDRLRDQFIRYEHDQGNMAVATNRFNRRMSRVRQPGERL